MKKICKHKPEGPKEAHLDYKDLVSEGNGLSKIDMPNGLTLKVAYDDYDYPEYVLVGSTGDELADYKYFQDVFPELDVYGMVKKCREIGNKIFLGKAIRMVAKLDKDTFNQVKK